MKTSKLWSRSACLFTLSVALFSIQNVRGQTPTLLWQTNVGASVIAVDSLTNVYASSNGTVITLTSAGVPVQTNILGQGRGRAQRDAAGNFYFAGIRPAFFDGTFYRYDVTNACYLAKFTSGGTLVWSNGFGPMFEMRQINVDDLQVDTNGTAYVGFTYFVDTHSHLSRVAKFDSTGSNVWTVAMPSVAGGPATAVGVIRPHIVSPTNGYVLSYWDNSFLSWTVTLSRFDTNGVATAITNWTIAHGSVPPVVQDSADNFFISSGRAQAGPVFLEKRTPQGAVIWSHDVGFSDQIPVGPDFYGGALVADTQSHLLRYDADGNLIWTMNLSNNCQEAISDASGNRFLSLVGSAIARIGPETLSGTSITNPPQSQTTFVGSNVVFSVGASGTTPFRYYWFFNGSLLSFQSNAVLSLPNVTTNQAGSYYVIVSNILNTATSSPVQLRVKQVELYVGNQLLTNGTYNFSTNPTITVRSAFPSGSAFYTLDGSAPSFSSTFYSGPFTLFTNATVRAIGYSSDFSQSEEADSINAVVLAHHSLSATTSGGGTITLNPPGGDYLSSDTVTATAVPDAGWSFLYWTGDATGSSNPIDLQMHSDKTIHAVFGTTLSTTVQGDGQVLLYPSPGPYYYGQIVRLTAVPNSGSYFGFWGNAATGNTNPLYFKVTNANPTVSSIFGTNGPNQVTLVVNINGRGSVTASPQANVYSTGQSVLITATPDLGQTFVNWTGDATGAQNPLNVVLNQSQVITANFSGGPLLKVKPEIGDGFHPEGFRFSVVGDSNSVYEIDYSSNLVSWSSLRFITNNTSETSVLDTNAVNFPKRYYQIKP